jgi:hypothetical protein
MVGVEFGTTDCATANAASTRDSSAIGMSLCANIVADGKKAARD